MRANKVQPSEIFETRMFHYLHELGGLGGAPAAQVECDGRRVVALGLLQLASLVLMRKTRGG